jgi:molybdenum cofactor biosynthesis enzyme MoaA
MANKTKVKPQKDKVPEKEGQETPSDSPLLDLSDAAVKKLIHSAKKRGYVTHDQINSVLPSEEVNSEQIEDVLAMFSEMGVNVVETEEASEEGGVSAVKSQMEVYRAKAKEYARLTIPTKSLRESRRYRKLAEMYWALALGEEPERVRPSKMIVKTRPT